MRFDWHDVVFYVAIIISAVAGTIAVMRSMGAEQRAAKQNSVTMLQEPTICDRGVGVWICVGTVTNRTVRCVDNVCTLLNVEPKLEGE